MPDKNGKFSAEDFEHMILYAIREQGLDSIIATTDTTPITRYANYLAEAYQRSFDSMEEDVDMQRIYNEIEMFEDETNIFMDSFEVALEIGGKKLKFSQIFGGERIGRVDGIICKAAKFILLFVPTWLALNISQNATRDQNLKPRLMKFTEKPINRRI